MAAPSQAAAFEATVPVNFIYFQRALWAIKKKVIVLGTSTELFPPFILNVLSTGKFYQNVYLNSYVDQPRLHFQSSLILLA